MEKLNAIAWNAEAFAAFAASVAANPYGPLESAQEVLQGAYLFEFEHRAQPLLLAVRPVPLSGGLRLDVVGMHGQGQRFQAAALDGYLCALARQHGAAALSMSTQHAGLVAAAKRHGWQQTGVVMTKMTGAVQ